MRTTCKCGATWSGNRIEHCTECHETFTGTSSGDKHRTGDHAVHAGPNRRRCLTTVEMAQRGMVRNARGQWTNGGTSPWARKYRMSEAVLIPGTPIFGCPVCFDPWESEPSCEHFDWTDGAA